MAALALILAACTSTTEPDTGVDPGPAAQPDDSGPIAGGTLTFGVLGEPPTLDPYSPIASDLTYALARPVYPSLYRFLPDGTPEPYLATSMVARPGRAVVTLREAEWSDGTPITARDVAATVRRASAPSGFVGLTARALGRRRVRLTGRVRMWPRTLARLAFVLPHGRVRRKVSGGPFEVRKLTSGLELILVQNESWWGGEPAHLDRVRVQFFQTASTMASLIDDGKLDAASLPSNVHLGERLEADGIGYESRLGWESIRLDLAGVGADYSTRLALASSFDRAVIEETFVREEGRIANTLTPEPGPAGASGPWTKMPRVAPVLSIAASFSAPQGDDLIDYTVRALHEQSRRAGHDLEVIQTDAARFYGPWTDRPRTDVALRRVAGAPGMPETRNAFSELTALPLFHVETFVAFRQAVQGFDVNPTVEGPLWNLEEVWLEPPAK